MATNVISKQPSSVSVVEGTNTSFKIEVTSGITATYQWQIYIDTGAPSTSVWKNLPSNSCYSNGTTKEMKITNPTIAATGSPRKYRCVVQGKVGNASFAVTSNTVTLTLTPVAKPAITTQPVNRSVVEGTSTSFSIAATGVAPLSYRWQTCVSGIWRDQSQNTWLSGVTTNTLKVTNPTVAAIGSSCKYRCVVKSSVSGETISNEVTLTVTAKPITSASALALALNSMAMTTAKKGTVTIILRGSGSVSINWGDGTSSSYTLSTSDCTCSHNYTGSTPRNIIITGATTTTKINFLKCSDNEVTDLNVTQNTTLTYLYCFRNKLTSLNVTGLANLSVLCCYSNQLTSLNVSGLTKLTNLDCATNSLTSLSVSRLTVLQQLSCGYNKLTSLSVSGLSKLTYLNCSSNNLASLNFSGCTGLKQLYCATNYLTGINANNFANLNYLSCYGNNLTTLNVSGSTLLEKIYCLDNKLTSLSVSGLAKLIYLSCKNNKIEAAALNNLFTSLNTTAVSGMNKEILIIGNPGTYGCNITTATNKQWVVDYQPSVLARGSNSVIQNMHSKVGTVLGSGYDISGEFAKLSGKGKVLNVDILNKYQWIGKGGGGSSKGTKIVEEGRKAFSETIEKDLSISVSASFFGVTLSSDTKNHFDKTETSDESYKYVMINLVHSNDQYTINAIPEQILDALTPEFTNALSAMTPDRIVEAFGTHVLMGMVLGSAMRYYMSFQKSVNTLSQTKTFSTTNSVGYGSGGTSKEADKKAADDNKKTTEENKKVTPSKKSFGEQVVEAITAGISVSKVKEAFAALKSISDIKPGGGAPAESVAKKTLETAMKTLNSAGISVQVSSTYSTSQSINSVEELEKTRTECYLIGGEITENFNILNDPSKCDTWLKSCQNSNNWVWIDFVKDKTIPIYEFVADPVKKQAVKVAWEKYLNSKGINTYTKPVEAVITQSFKTRRERNKTVFMENGDWEMMGKKGRHIGYELSFELVSIDGGTAGVDVVLRLVENDSKNDQSILVVHQLIPLEPQHGQGFDKFTIHPQALGSYRKITGTYICKDGDDWLDLTAAARNNDYDYNAAKGSGFLDLGTSLKIQLDGPGDDHKNVGVEGKFTVKVIGYKR